MPTSEPTESDSGLDTGGLEADDFGTVTVRFSPESLTAFVACLNAAQIHVGGTILGFEAVPIVRGKAEIQVTELEVESGG